MSRHALKAGDDLGMLIAFSDEITDLQKEYSLRVAIKLNLTSRRGVLRLSLSAVDDQADIPDQVVCTYSVEYPTAQVVSFETALYQAAVKLEHMVRYKFLYPRGKE